jgi:RimJ/RimL family protein N-acetyltransferase
MELTIMSENRLWSEHAIRKLRPYETDAFRDHLLRLDDASRRMRFAHAVSDDFINDYAARMSEMGSIIFGYFDTGHELRAVAELRKLTDDWAPAAEAAFSVETDLQNTGIGTHLMGRVIRSARNRGVHHLYMSCLAENRKMQNIAKKHEADLRFEYGEVIGDIIPDAPNYFSQFAEAVDDQVGYLMAVVDLSARARRAA